ncbi:hypothetical protein [Sphingobacterium paucimobilis]|uniref:Glycerophosphoryl diester phosphodiesterase membrane domain-containing protein n=1 Tax=Sphingobacterium paucimobilis HER1398 TaxID=1346330 RepID=U2JAW4_9SPHI|nr:hypothetical protein [Sphingobacterium paucimobilis]ERJ59803.1 hypothetical protein M472_13605 [Sphingobacterium paucimobilis HER1398]
MLEFLKESTFKANDVFFRALNILKKHYISVAGLCFLLFVTNNLSAFLAMYLSDITGSAIKVLLLLVFVILFFGLQLVLVKRAILLASNVEHAALMTYIPSPKQFLNFLSGLIIYSLLTSVVYLGCAILCMPLLYMGVQMETILSEINPLLTGIFMMFILIRISFFPFFILEKNHNIFRAARLSIAFTKGNVMNLFMLMLVLASAYILQMTFEYFEYPLFAKISSILNTFIIIPSVSLVMAIAYVDMMKEYKGSDDPELFKNII